MIGILLSLEFWLPIQGYDKEYLVSSFGKVLDGVTLLKQYSDTNGYSYVSLCKDGKRVNRSVHRLVSQAFLPNPKSLPMVNHYKGFLWKRVKFEDIWQQQVSNY